MGLFSYLITKAFCEEKILEYHKFLLTGERSRHHLSSLLSAGKILKLAVTQSGQIELPLLFE